MSTLYNAEDEDTKSFSTNLESNSGQQSNAHVKQLQKRDLFMQWFTDNKIQRGDPFDITQAFVRSNRAKLAQIIQQNNNNDQDNSGFIKVRKQSLHQRRGRVLTKLSIRTT